MKKKPLRKMICQIEDSSYTIYCVSRVKRYECVERRSVAIIQQWTGVGQQIATSRIDD